jgi:hypothetical protein
VDDGGEEAESGWVPREQYARLQHKLEAAKVCFGQQQMKVMLC